jgi:hypothetical protein
MRALTNLRRVRQSRYCRSGLVLDDEDGRVIGVVVADAEYA